MLLSLTECAVVDFKSVSCEVPQSSIPSPLLFLLSENGLYLYCKNGFFILLPNDTNIFLSEKLHKNEHFLLSEVVDS